MRINQNNGGSGGGVGGGVQLGGAQVGFTPGMIQYITTAGTQGGDVLAIRSDVTNYTDILKDFSVSEQGGFRITADVTGGNFANPVPGSFLVSEDTVTNIYGFSGAGDISGLTGVAPGLLNNGTAMASYSSVSGDIAATKVYYYDGSLGGDAEFVHATDIVNGNFLSSFVADGAGFSAAADDVVLQQTSGISLQNNTISAQLLVVDNVTNFQSGVLAGLTGVNMYMKPVFTGTKDWQFAMIDNVVTDEVSLSFSQITDGYNYFLVDPIAQEYKLGDVDATGSGSFLHINDFSGLTNLWTLNLHVQSPAMLNAPLIYIDSTVKHTRLGYNAGGNSSLLAGGENTYVGWEAGFGTSGSLGQANTCVGYRAGYALNTVGDENTLIGHTAGDSITTGQNNTMMGYGSGRALTTQSDNVVIGVIAGDLLASADNTIVGTFAAGLTTSGSNLAIFGRGAGLTNTTGSSHVLIGSGADVSTGALNASIGIGRAVSITASNQLKFGSASYPIYEAYIGDYTAAQNGLYLRILDTSQTIGLGDLDGTRNNTKITLDDTTGGKNIQLNGTNLVSLASDRILMNGSMQYKRTAVNDADKTINANEYLISMENLSASRTVTVPDASTAFAGRTYIIKDADGLAGTWNIILDPTGTDTIDNAATYTMNTNYQSITLVSDGVSNWEII